MDTIFTFTLITHVIAGVIGVMTLYAILMNLFKRKSSIRFLKFASVTAFVSYLMSWFSGGYYYVLRYGPEVKPLIKGGDYPFVHSFFMETKEHLFLLLPILTFILMLVFFFREKEIVSGGKTKQALVYITVLSFVTALFITLSGILISGSAG